MRIANLTPNEYWATDVIDLELGAAVQEAWREGQAAAREGLEMQQAMANRLAQLTGRRPQC